MTDDYTELDALFTPREREHIQLVEEILVNTADLLRLQNELAQAHKVLDGLGVPQGHKLPTRIWYLATINRNEIALLLAAIKEEDPDYEPPF